MKLDWKMVGASVIGAAIALVIYAYLVTSGPEVCEKDESVLTCLREWSNMIAAIGTIGAIYFAYRTIQGEASRYFDQKAEENRIRRLKLDRTQIILQRLIVCSDQVEGCINKYNSLIAGGEDSKNAFISSEMAAALSNAHTLFREKAWEELREFIDGKFLLMTKVAEGSSGVGEALYEYVRSAYGNEGVIDIDKDARFRDLMNSVVRNSPKFTAAARAMALDMRAIYKRQGIDALD